jgi:hypothetical protein
MYEHSSSIDIQAPPSVVWSIVSDVEHWPNWTPTVTRLTKLTPGPLAVGMAARIIQPKLPPAIWRVTEIHDGHDFTWVNERLGVKVFGSHVVEPLPDGGTRATVSVRFTGFLSPIVARLARRLNEDYLDLEAKGLKARSEAAALTSPTASRGSS